MDEIEFRQTEQDHRKATFKILANWCNIIVTGETSFTRLSIS